MGDELRWLIKEMGGCISRVVIFLPHVVSLTLLMYTCSDSAMLFVMPFAVIAVMPLLMQ